MVTILLQKILDLLKAKLGLINTTPETASGATVVFDTDKELPLDVLKATITATQEAGTPSPEAPKEITGYSSVVITQKDESDTTVDEVTIELGQTVYGGILDCINGTLTITQKYFTYTEAQYYGIYGDSNAPLYFVEINDYQTEPVKNMQNSKLAGVLISNLFTKITVQNATSMLDNELRTQAGSSPQYFYFRSDGFADLTAVNAFLAETPLQVVAELQTPIVINLTPANITTIIGTNKLSANCGNLELGYRISDEMASANKDISSDITVNTTDFSGVSYKVIRAGNVVMISLYGATVVNSTPAALFTGLPKPYNNVYVNLIDTVSNGIVAGSLTNNGSLGAAAAEADQRLSGLITYITKDEV